MSENWYPSARRDALKAAALVGVGYLAYKGYKKVSSLSDRELLGIILGLLLFTAIPAVIAVAVLTLPLYVYWRVRLFSAAERKLRRLEPKLEALWERYTSLQQRLDGLPLTAQEKEEGIEAIEKEQAKVWSKACKCASFIVTRFQWRINGLRNQKDQLVRSVEKISDNAAKARMNFITGELDRLESGLADLREQYDVNPLHGWFFLESFLQAHAAFLIIAVVLLWIPALAFIDAF